MTADLVTGLTASVSGGVASIYATDAVSTTASFNTQLIGLTDSSGKGGSLTGATVTTLVTAPQGVSGQLVDLSRMIRTKTPWLWVRKSA